MSDATLKIVMICDFFGDGLEYQENLLLRYYRKLGHDVTVLTSTIESVHDYVSDRYDPSAPARSYTFDGARIERRPFGLNLLNRLRTYPDLEAALSREAPDFIFVHETLANLPAVVRHLKRNPACKAVVDCHSDYSNAGNRPLSLQLLHGVVRARLLSRARPHLARIFPVVPASATFLHEVYGVPHEEMELLPLGVDIDLLASVEAEAPRSAVRASLDIPLAARVVVSGGKLTQSKRTDVLLDAWRDRGDPEEHLILIGAVAPDAGSYAAELCERLAQCRNVHFTGWLTPRDVYRHLLSSDLAVFPASQSIMWQQAVAAGLPLIVGDVGHQSIGYLNLYGNIVTLPAAEITPAGVGREMNRILADAALRRAMSEGAMRVGREELDWNELAARTLRFCRGAAAPSVEREV